MAGETPNGGEGAGVPVAPPGPTVLYPSPIGDVPPAWRARLTAALRAFFAAEDPGLASDLLAMAEWIRVPSGQRLLSEGEPGDSMYIVIAGRFVVHAADAAGAPRFLGDIRPGESVGEMGLLASQPRTATVEAVRDSVAVRIGAEVFHRLAARHPALVSVAARLVIRRATALMRGRLASPPRARVGIVPLRKEVRCDEFVRRLDEAMQPYGSTLVLNAARRGEILASRGLSRADSYEQRYDALWAWLDEQESHYDSIIHVAPSVDDRWTDHLIHDADVVLLVAPFDSVPDVAADERGLWDRQSPMGPRRELVLLHAPGSSAVAGTRGWLASPRNVARHHHVRLDHDEDFRRLARFVTGNAVGLVLSGGGARGFAHLGVIRALRERGVAIDAVGGTSQGAIVAGCVAAGWDDDLIARRHREAFSRNPTGDYFLVPHIALVRGKRLEEGLQQAFGTTDIEDLPLSMFCVSTNLTRGKVEVHRHGPLWKAIRASISLPGILPPVVIGDELHVDGGLLDNLPVQAMREPGIGRVIAVDATVKQEMRLRGGDLPGVVEAVTSLVFADGNGPALGLRTILMESMMVSTRQQAAQVAASVDLYLNPQPAAFGLLEWDSVERCARFGYEHARRELADADLASVLDLPPAREAARAEAR